MSLALQLNDYRMTTAEILYRMPDFPEILQTLYLAGARSRPRISGAAPVS